MDSVSKADAQIRTAVEAALADMWSVAEAMTQSDYAGLVQAGETVEEETALGTCGVFTT